jgi:Bacteriophage Mu-like, Gp48
MAATRRPRALALRSNLPDIFPDDDGGVPPRPSGHAETFASVGYEADELRLALDGILAAAVPGIGKAPLVGGRVGPTRFPAWAASRWERDLGLPVDETRPLEDRVAAILARLRGFGTATRRRIQSVANGFENGQVAVIEDYASYTVTFRFVSLLGQPPYLDAVQAGVEALVPAHLLTVWEFVYTTYGMLTDYVMHFADFGGGLTYGDLPTYPDPTP